MRLLRFLLLFALTGLLLASVSARADASTVSVVGSDIQLTAAPGEANVVAVANGQNGNSYVVSDTAGATAGAGCNAQTPTSVSCNVGGLSRVRINLGDGADSFDAGLFGESVEVLGGAGNDTLTGGVGADQLNGEDGDDTLDGGPYIVSNMLLADVLRGGAGIDTVSYAGRGNPVRVDIDGGYDDGEAGEYDNVGTDVERVFGGSANDVLLGSAGADEFHGGGGNDVLDGRDGDDTLYGDGGSDTIDGRPGIDTIDGGDGADTVTSRDSGAADTVACGADADSVTADREDAVSACETVDVPPLPEPEPQPTVEPTPTPTATPAATPTPAPTAAPQPTPTPVPEEDPAVTGATPSPVVTIVERVIVVAPQAPELSVTLSCGSEQAGDCVGTVKVTTMVPRSPGKASISRRGRKMKEVALGSAKFRIKKGRSKVVKAKMSRRGVTQALKTAKPTKTAKGPGKRIKARMTVSMRSKDGSSTTIRRPFDIDVPKGEGR